MYGVNLLFGLITARDAGENPMEESRWSIIMLTVDLRQPGKVSTNN
jgi:hypothetical protein